VAFAPGTAFGSIGEGWIRIALCGNQADLVEGLLRLPAREPAADRAGTTGPVAGTSGAIA